MSKKNSEMNIILLREWDRIIKIKPNSLTSNMNVCILLKFVVGMTISFNVILYIDIRNGMNSRNQQNLPA